MNSPPRRLTLDEWDARYAELCREGLSEPDYGGPLRRHVRQQKDFRLEQLCFDNSPAALRLWNLLLTENDRLHQARGRGEKIVGTMKDLGTVPVIACSFERLRAFYPDGAWWTPCLMCGSDHLLEESELWGVDGSFCPVRAMLAAFQNGQHFPKPDLLICSAGAVCDDFSAIAQRLEHLGHPVLWWEIPRRRSPEAGEVPCALPGNLVAPRIQVDCVRSELQRVGGQLASLAGQELNEDRLVNGIRAANEVRHVLHALRQAVYGAPAAPLPGLEMLISEMLAIHFCSDRQETLLVLKGLLAEAQRRETRKLFVNSPEAVRVFWVNPVADLRAMNLLEELGGCLCGSDFMFTHALDPIPEELPPWEAMARTALADPMIGPAQDRAHRIIRECRAGRAEAVVVSRIPGASHCAREGQVIRELVRREAGIPTVEIEIPSLCDAMLPALTSRLQALLEVARARRLSRQL